MNKIKNIFSKEAFNFSIFLGITTVLFAFFVTATIFKNNYDFYNDNNIYAEKKVVVNVAFNKVVDSSVFYSNLNECDFNYLTEDYSYEKDIKTVNYVKGVYDKDLQDVYPLHSGEFLSSEELNSDNKVVLLGKNLERFTYEKNGKTYTEIEGEEFLVKGWLGRETSSKYSVSILMPIRTFYETFEINTGNQYNIEIDKKNYDEIIKKISSKFGDEIVSIEPLEMEEINAIQKSFDLEKNILINLLIAILFSLICMIVFTLLWMDNIGRNIAIKRALGANSNDIFRFMFQNITVIFSMAITCNIILFMLVKNTLLKLTVFPIVFNFKIFVATVIVVLLLNIIICAILVRSSLNLNISTLSRS